MTSFASLGFDDLTTDAFKAGALSGWVDKALHNAHGYAIRLVLVPLLARTLENFVRRLKTRAFDSLSSQQLQELAGLLTGLHKRLERMIQTASQRQVHWFSTNSRNYVRIATANEDLADVIEAIALSQSPAFRAHVEAAVRELHV